MTPGIRKRTTVIGGVFRDGKSVIEVTETSVWSEKCGRWIVKEGPRFRFDKVVSGLIDQLQKSGVKSVRDGHFRARLV